MIFTIKKNRVQVIRAGGVSLASIAPACDDELAHLMHNDDGSPRVLSPAELLYVLI